MFLWTWRLVAKKERPGDSIGIGFEIILVFTLCAVYFALTDLVGVRQHDGFASASASDFLLIGTPGVYGIRLARFIARARQYRMPQTLEWLVFLVPLLTFLTLAVGSGHFVRLYAAGQGYTFCGPRPDHSQVYVFARPPHECPVLPEGTYWRH